MKPIRAEVSLADVAVEVKKLYDQEKMKAVKTCLRAKVSMADIAIEEKH